MSELALTKYVTTIKNARKGRTYGFAVGPDNIDIFIHESVIISQPGDAPLCVGDEVILDAERNTKGFRATRVERTGSVRHKQSK